MKNPIVAFILAFFPGGGLFYIGRKSRGFLYGVVVFGFVVLAFAMVTLGMYGGDIVFLPILTGFIIYCISIIDTLLTTSRYYKQKGHYTTSTIQGEYSDRKNVESDRFYTIVLSFVPGLGHLQIGLVYRGITLLTTFLGIGIMILFVAFLTHRSEFLLFLAILPVIWIFSFFDVMQQFNKKLRGEVLEDVTILQDFERSRESGRKSKFIATFLSIFPGAGHLYLGLQQRGIQLMAAFLFSIFILNELRLGIFLFLIPIIWCFSFFDGLQKAASEEEVEDVPVIAYLINYQKWCGIGLLVIGLYYLTQKIILPILSPVLRRLIDVDLYYFFYQYFQTGIVCVVLILGGIHLLKGNKKKRAKTD